jgi:hypothetical protein
VLCDTHTRCEAAELLKQIRNARTQLRVLSGGARVRVLRLKERRTEMKHKYAG